MRGGGEGERGREGERKEERQREPRWVHRMTNYYCPVDFCFYSTGDRGQLFTYAKQELYHSATPIAQPLLALKL